MDLVSIVIPNYNHAVYLDKRIDSVLNQSYSDFEVIILDDCSTDNSLDIIHKYETHPRIKKIISNSRNSGSIIQQWRKGLRESRGEFIWIAESDDVADPDFLKLQMDLLTGSAECGFIFSNSHMIDEQGDIIGSMEKWKNNFFNTGRWNESYHNSGKDELFEYLIISCTINNLSSCVFRKAVLMNALKTKAKLKVSFDWLVYMNLLMETNVIYNQKKINYYRVHKRNASKDFDAEVEKFLALVYFLRENEFSVEEKKIVNFRIAHQLRNLMGLLKQNKISGFVFFKTILNLKDPWLLMIIFYKALIYKISDK